MKRIAAVALVIFLVSAFGCSRNATQVANTATDDAFSTGPTTNTATSAPATPVAPTATSAKTRVQASAAAPAPE